MQSVNSFLNEEVRSGFLVTTKRKKVWSVELNLLKKFDEVCRKYNLKYYADYGTLLGAVRHKGFIPWDDDLDLTMFRDDYERLKDVAYKEFSEPYFFQDSYSDSMMWAFSKLRDSRTTAIEFPDAPSSFHQGIFIDIFPLDDAPDEFHMKSSIRDIQRELWLTIVNPEKITSLLRTGYSFLLDNDLLLDLLSLPLPQRMREFENFNLSRFGTSDKINFITDELFHLSASKNRYWYRDTVYLPFEHLFIPAPVDYDSILKAQYGNYMDFVTNGSSHEGILLDPDIPYTHHLHNTLINESP